MYGLHLLITTLVMRQFPSSGVWWGTIFVEAVIVTTVGEILCGRRDARRLANNIRRMEGTESASPAGSPTDNASPVVKIAVNSSHSALVGDNTAISRKDGSDRRASAIGVKPGEYV